MLKQRVITALALLALLLPAMFASNPWPFMGLTVVLIAAGAWEWGRLNGMPAWLAWSGAAICLLACAVAEQLGWVQRTPPLVWLLAGAMWVLLGAWMIQRGVAGWRLWPRGIRWMTGLLLLTLAWIAMAQAHQRGVNFLLSVLALVWAADVFAYFFGKTLGKRKLAPRVSPGKSWEGAIGGAFSVLAISWLVVMLADSVPALEDTWQVMAFERWHPIVFSFWLLVLSAYSVVGDLFESMLKRKAGLKDSSSLLPGHGGILDRIDAQLPVLPLAVLLVSAVAG